MPGWITGLVGDIVKRDDGQVPFGVSSGPAQEVRIYSVHIISTGTAGEVKLYNGKDTTGELRYQLKGTASTGITFDIGGVEGALFEDGCFCDFVTDANIESVTFSYYGAGVPSSSSSSSSRSSSSSSCSSSCSSSSSSCRSSSSSSRSSSSSSNSSSSSSSSCRSSSSSSRSSSSSCSSSSSSFSSSSCSSSSSSCRSSSSSSANP